MDDSLGVRSQSGFANTSRGSWLWYFASSIPLIFLFCLFALTFYSIPESDDFCLSYLHLENGFAGGISILYKSLSGRVIPLFLIQVPVAISDVTGIDYFISYPATLAALMLLLFAGVLFLSFRLRTDNTIARPFFFGVALSAVMLSEAPLLREMLYWLPGVACYTLPGIILVIVLNEFVRGAESGARFTRLDTSFLAAGCFFASLSNEFTPVSLVALVLGSLAFRAFFKMHLQIREHTIIAGAALLGFVILISAPGNGVRMAQFPAAGLLFHSLKDALLYSATNLIKFMIKPVILAWLIAVVLYTATESRPVDACARKRRYLAAFVLMFCLGSGYLAYFAHQFSTGLRLSERAQNQMVMLLVCGLTISTVMLARASREWLRLKLSVLMPAQQRGLGTNSVLLMIAATLVLPPLYFSKTARLIRAEQGSFRTFWIESVERHRRLGLPTPSNIALPPHTVFPSALMGGDITEDPSRLPNDCIARFYKKDAVVVDRAAPSTQ
jgi:hypothetical protein